MMRILLGLVALIAFSVAVPKHGYHGHGGKEQSQTRTQTLSPQAVSAQKNENADKCPGSSKPDISCAAISAEADLRQADAAEEQTSINWFQSVVGAFTLLAAGLAAKFAKEAADHTETGAIQARRAADAAHEEIKNTRHASRAHLTSERQKVSWSNDTLGLSIQIRNTGSTVAQNVCGSITVLLLADDDTRIVKDGTPWDYGTLARGEELELEWPGRKMHPDDAQIVHGGAEFFGTLLANYVDAWNEERTYVYKFLIDQESIKRGVLNSVVSKDVSRLDGFDALMERIQPMELVRHLHRQRSDETEHG